MSRLQSIKHQHSLKVFRTRARKVAFPHQFVDFKRADTLGFIINIGLINAEDLVFFVKYLQELEEMGKKVILVELNLQKDATSMFTQSIQSIFINSRKINWLDFPTVSTLKAINSAKIDILFNLDTSERMTSRFICGLSNAKMRVGMHEEESKGFYELMLQLEPGTPLQKVLETSLAYTNKLEKQ